MIELKNITIQYIKDYATIFGVDFCINSNTIFLSNYDEIVALFRVLTKIEKRYTGKIYIDNQDIKELADKDLQIAYVPKSPYLFRSKSLKENLIYPLKIRRFKKDEINTRYNQVYEKYLGNFPKKINKLNNSQRKILTLLRSTIWNPKYIIIEHFFDDLDIEYIDLAEKIIDKLSKNTIIIASENDTKKIYSNFKQIVIDNGSMKNGTK